MNRMVRNVHAMTFAADSFATGCRRSILQMHLLPLPLYYFGLTASSKPIRIALSNSLKS